VSIEDAQTGQISEAFASPNATPILVHTLETLVGGAALAYLFRHHRHWPTALASAAVAGFGLGVLHAMTPPEKVVQREVLGTATFVLGGLGTGVALHKLLRG
jgi:hypothetical protein